MKKPENLVSLVSLAGLAGLGKLGRLARLVSLALLALLVLLAPAACVDEQAHDDTPQGNFESLWQIIDEHYCFFDYKDIDWNAL